MKTKTSIFGFNTKSLETLNSDLAACNYGVLPDPSEIKEIKITLDDGGPLLLVQVVLRKVITN